MGDAKVRLNKEDGKVEDIKIGDKTLIILEKSGDKTTLKSVMVERKQLVARRERWATWPAVAAC
jgi:hypothetical protein